MFSDLQVKHLNPALKIDGNHDINDIWNLYQKHAVDLWHTQNATVITEVIKFPKRKVLNIWLAGGEMDGCKNLHKEITKFAKKINCKTITITGRPGWKKIFPEYKKTAELIGFDL